MSLVPVENLIHLERVVSLCFPQAVCHCHKNEFHNVRYRKDYFGTPCWLVPPLCTGEFDSFEDSAFEEVVGTWMNSVGVVKVDTVGYLGRVVVMADYFGIVGVGIADYFGNVAEVVGNFGMVLVEIFVAVCSCS